MTTDDNQSRRLEAALLALTQSVQILIEETRTTNANINNLVEHLYTRRDVVANDVLDIKEDLHELKEITRHQSQTADRYAISAQTQAESVKTQAENIRLLIEMVNRKQA
jgi:flagellar hook-associated protein FlgK